MAGTKKLKVEIELANNDDLVAARCGKLENEKVRRLITIAIVNPKVSGLVLPSGMAKKLGIPVVGKVKVEYTDGTATRRDRVEGTCLEMLGRRGLYWAHLEPGKRHVVVGRIVLNDLDLVADDICGRIYPRDPRFITAEIG